MSTQDVIAGLILCLVVGWLAGAITVEYLVAAPARRARDRARERFIRHLIIDSTANPWRDNARVAFEPAAITQHYGYPVQGKPGLRVIEGEVMYSADWLDSIR